MVCAQQRGHGTLQFDKPDKLKKGMLASSECAVQEEQEHSYLSVRGNARRLVVPVRCQTVLHGRHHGGTWIPLSVSVHHRNGIPDIALYK